MKHILQGTDGRIFGEFQWITIYRNTIYAELTPEGKHGVISNLKLYKAEK
ncbi:hypothetical protein [Kineothrix sp. MB12-C1]|nr:hypothetical protein [Kineothrix sp. MB12-C1]WMC91353.1 hypothetical protein RBB56_10725 [Kineothrix sp. MB12-C1]